MASREGGGPVQSRHTGTAALGGHKQDTAIAAASSRPLSEDALVLIERGVAVEAVPYARYAEIRVADFARNVTSVVEDLPLERLAVAIVVRDTPRRETHAAIRELLAIGVNLDELQVHRVEPTRRVIGGAR